MKNKNIYSSSYKKKLFNKSNIALSISLILATSYNALAFAETPVEKDEAIEIIMVTGQKFTRTLQETPTSVAVFNSSIIEELNVNSLDDLLFEVANVQSNANGSFNIRGIDGFNVSGAGTSALASVYLDGSPLPERMIRNSVSTWDINQVEIFRGPQSTVQGRNALAGALVLTSTAPTYEWGGKYRVQVGQHGETEGAIAVGGGLIENQLAFRFSGEIKDFDGFNYNTVRNEHSDFRKDENYRLKFLLTPDGMPDFSAHLSLLHTTTSTGVLAVNVPENGSPFNNRITTSNDPQRLDYETDIINLEMDYAINDEIDFISVTTYSEVMTNWKDYDTDDGPEDTGTRFFEENNETFTQEFRFLLNYEKLTGVIGAYYFDQKLPSTFGGTSPIGLSESGVNSSVLQARFGLDEGTANFVVSQYAPFDPVILDQLTTSQQKITSYALFTDITYSINEEWDITAGLRLDREEQKNNSYASFTVANIEFIPDASLYPAPLNQLIAGINGQLLNNVDEANKEIPLADGSFNRLIPKLGISYHWSESLTTSFTLQQGYRSGGVGVNGARSLPFQFDPEYTTNYEFSMRSKWLNDSLTINANAFYTDWKDQQVNIQLSANSFDKETQNAGTSTVKGFELELNYQLSSKLTFYSSLGLSKTEFTNFLIEVPVGADLDNNGVEDVQTRDLSGRSFPDAPKWTANFGATYKNDNGVFANISANYADKSLANIDPKDIDGDGIPEDDYNEGRTLVNIKIGYDWDSFGIYLIGKNILNEEYISGAAFGRAGRTRRHNLGDPRQLSVSLRGTF